MSEFALKITVSINPRFDNPTTADIARGDIHKLLSNWAAKYGHDVVISEAGKWLTGTKSAEDILFNTLQDIVEQTDDRESLRLALTAIMKYGKASEAEVWLEKVSSDVKA